MRRSIALITVALIGLTALELHFLWDKTSTAPIANNIVVLGIFNIILILLFLLIVLITRNLVKLYNERKSKIVGSKFQVKLILAFLILAMVPSLLLFFVGSKLFTYTIGNWFSLQVEQSLKQSMEVAREYYSHLEQRGLFHATQVEVFITKDRLYLKENREPLRQLVADKVHEYQLGGIVIYDNERSEVMSFSNPSLPVPLPKLDFTNLMQGNPDEAEKVSEIRLIGNENYLVVVDPLVQKIDDKKAIWGYIITLSQVPKSTLMKIEGIRQMYEEYKQQSLIKLPVSANYYITFLMITLLILFSAIWLGFYMARGITVPIQQLAEGTRRIAGGDLSFKIEVNATDEIGFLVDSFNNMTNELKESRGKIESAHEDLQHTNIELERRRYYNETLLSNIAAGVISIDKKGRITTLNQSAERILDIENQDLLGTTYKDAFDPSFHEPIRKMIKKLNQEGKDSIQDQVEFNVGENHLILLVNIKPMRDAKNKYLGLLIVFEDLTQLIKAQKIAAWKEVAQGIAHEIKNPLTPIQLNAQRLKKKYYEDKKGFARVFDESIQIITQEVEGMKDLLNEFVRFSRMPTPNPRPGSLSKIIEDVALLYQNHEKRIAVKTNYDPNIGNFNIDSEQIRRVFINLFDNAITAITDEGNIEITTKLNKEKKIIKIDFSDDGVGIDPKDRDKLFLPHYSTKKRGTGLGLAIVNRIIIDHSGTIHARDNDPKGTVFTIELPYLSATSKDRKILQSKKFRKTSPPF